MNKLIVTGAPYSHMYLVEDWSSVKCILDSNTVDPKSFAFTMPLFDEKLFPFIFVVGEQHISILNINNLEL